MSNYGVAPHDGTSRYIVFVKVSREPLQNAHILSCMLCFFIGSRLVLERNPHFCDGLKTEFFSTIKN
jgi:hypothetical protein